ncbi:hypothetical protein Tco_0040165 [Tanacetum coccineum]
MVEISFDLNELKDSLNTDEAAQNDRAPKSVTFEIHHGCFTPTPSRSYVGGHVSSVNVVDIDEFCLYDLKDIVVKLGYGVADLMYYHFLIPRLGLDYGLHTLNVDADVLEMANIFVTLKKAPIEIDSSPDVNRSLTPMCYRNLKIEWEHVNSKSLSIGEVMKNLSKKQHASSVEGPIVVESIDNAFEDLDEILGDYTNTGKQITVDEITGKQMVVHVDNSSTVDDVLDLHMLFEIEGVVPIGKFKEVEVDVDNESKEESDTEGNDTTDHIIKTLATNPSVLVRAVQDQIQKQFDVGVSKMKAFRAKRIATAVRIDVQQEPNPESLTRTFRRVYVCLGALKQGFIACGREILRLDGCFMSGPWPEDLGIEANFNYTFISDRQKGLIQVIASVFPSVEHSQSHVGEFNKKMAELKSYNSGAYDWLMKISAEQWSKSHFSGRAKCDLLLNNICDVFNRQLVDGRDQPIITCLQYIREYLMKRIVVVRKVIAKTVGPLTPYVTAMFDAIKKGY